jgi:hypothetical protein
MLPVVPMVASGAPPVAGDKAPELPAPAPPPGRAGSGIPPASAALVPDSAAAPAATGADPPRLHDPAADALHALSASDMTQVMPSQSGE